MREFELHEDWRLLSLCFLFTFTILVRLSFFQNWPAWYWFAGVATFAGFSLLFRLDKQTYIWIVFIILSGLSLSSYRVENIPEPLIDREIYTELTGTVVRAEIRPGKPARLLLHVKTSSKNAAVIDKSVRLSVRTRIPKYIAAGDHVAVNSVFTPMNGPIVPGGFDFGLYNRLNGISAQGFAVSVIEKEIQNNPDQTLLQHIEAARTQISETIRLNVGQEVAGTAISLITGQRHYLDDKTSRTLRDAGLSHLLAISGLHMGLITGAAFFIFELLFAALPIIALRVTPKKAAAVSAWVFALCYLILSGAGTATLRAFIMVTVAILAVITDRRVISQRSVALAAFIILIYDPAAILSISFQMSFAATAALVLAYETYASRAHKQKKSSTFANRSYLRKLAMYVFGVTITSIVAQIAVAPVAIYHFQAVSLVGTLANIIAIPIMAFVVMPAAFLSLIFIAVGLEPLPLFIVEQGIHSILFIAHNVSTLEHAVYRTPPHSAVLLPLLATLIAVSILMRGKIGLILWAASALFLPFTTRLTPSNILIDAEGKVIAHHLSHHHTMEIVGGRRGSFRDEAWQRYWSIDPNKPPQRLVRTCDTRACRNELTKTASGSKLPAIMRTTSLGETRRACARGDIVIASYTHKSYCRGASLFLSSEDIQRFGPVGLWLDSKKTSSGNIKVRWSIPNPYENNNIIKDN